MNATTHRLKRAVVLAVVAIFASLNVAENAVAQEEIKLGGPRIINGERTQIEKHPWQLAITIKRPDGGYLCGGSYIAEKWVLSASHCFRSSDTTSAIRAKAGATNYVDEGIWSEVDRVITHESYSPKTYEHDIALIKLKIAPAARVIPPAHSIIIPVGQPLEVTGWGTTTESGQMSKLLLRATVPYVENATCNEPASYAGRVLSGMMCAGHRSGGTDACEGDSGGPLVWRSETGPILVGIVSVGVGCARELKYGLYTRVSEYHDWINRTVEINRN